ncbi:MAG TPA: hypothetical protein VMP11_10850 [Verrucomicrobiae bacterium]|nr:hypothetical protein [Verrucomicrobiae bacterium]
MKLEEIRSLFQSFLAEESLEVDGSPSDFAPVSNSEKPLGLAIETYLRENEYPEPEFYDIASNFFHSQGEYRRVEEMLVRWKRSKGNPITPIIRHALLYFADGYIGYEECLAHIQEGLQQEPGNPFLPSIAYVTAFQEEDTGRRLHYAGQLAAISAEAGQQIVYGLECGENLLVDRAQAAFARARELDATDVRGLNGMGKCRLEKLDLDRAEELLHQSLQLKETPFAKKALETVARLRNGKAWSDEEKRFQKFWTEWTDTQLKEITAAEQPRLMAECFAPPH